MKSHENFAHHQVIEPGSDKSFGLVMFGALTFFGILPFLKHGKPNWVLIGLALPFLILAFVAPSVLRPLNILWTKLGILMGKVMTPIVMGVIFYLVITPISLILKLLAKDLLHLNYEPDASSYWVVRNPPGPKGSTMKQQF